MRISIELGRRRRRWVGKALGEVDTQECYVDNDLRMTCVQNHAIDGLQYCFSP